MYGFIINCHRAVDDSGQKADDNDEDDHEKVGDRAVGEEDDGDDDHDDDEVDDDYDDDDDMSSEGGSNEASSDDEDNEGCQRLKSPGFLRATTGTRGKQSPTQPQPQPQPQQHHSAAGGGACHNGDGDAHHGTNIGGRSLAHSQSSPTQATVNTVKTIPNSVKKIADSVPPAISNDNISPKTLAVTTVFTMTAIDTKPLALSTDTNAS